jgi:hypothetical protein
LTAVQASGSANQQQSVKGTMARDQSLRRFVVFVLVVGAHVLLLMLPFDTERREREVSSGRRMVLFFTRTPVIERKPPELRPPAEPMFETNIAVEAPTAITLVPLSEPATGGPSTGASVDWTDEAQRAAAAAAAKVPTPDRSKCDSTGLGDPTLPNCKPSTAFKWAPPKAGFANGLPYFTVGDRCVIGLGFFGCGLGKPPADGKLFDGMDDPERPRSSVPE